MAGPISIIIPAFNQLECCRECIASIQRNTQRPFRLILVDNGSTDGVAEFFDSVPDAVVIHSATNLGFAGGVNLGLRRAEGHALLLNSDTLVPEGWLGRLETALLDGDDVGMVGPMSNNVSGEQLIEGLSLNSWEDIEAVARRLAVERAGTRRDVQRLVGFCLLIREAVVAKVGLFDERFGIGNYEDDDYCLRVRAAGYRLRIVEDAFVFHYGSCTFAGMGLTGAKWFALLDGNRERFEEKWHGAGDGWRDAAPRSLELNEQAREALRAGDRIRALRLLKDAVTACPILDRNYNDLGVVLHELGQHDDAFNQFVRAVRLNPADIDARDNLRELAKTLGRMEEVREIMDR